MSKQCKAAAFTVHFTGDKMLWERGYSAFSKQCSSDALDGQDYCFVHKKSPIRQDFINVQSEQPVKKIQNSTIYGKFGQK